MQLLKRLEYYRDAVAAVKTYGNENSQHGILMRAQLRQAMDEVPAEVARLRAEAEGLAAAEAYDRAGELTGLADELEQFQPDAPPVVAAPEPKRRRRHG